MMKNAATIAATALLALTGLFAGTAANTHTVEYGVLQVEVYANGCAKESVDPDGYSAKAGVFECLAVEELATRPHTR